MKKSTSCGRAAPRAGARAPPAMSVISRTLSGSMASPLDARRRRPRAAFPRRRDRGREARRASGPIACSLDPQPAGGFGDRAPAGRRTASRCPASGPCADPARGPSSAVKRSASRNSSERKGRFLMPVCGVVQGQRVDGLDLEAADAALLHHPHLALDLRLRDRGPEPPPAHHDPAVVRRLREELPEVDQRRSGACSASARADAPALVRRPRAAVRPTRQTIRRRALQCLRSFVMRANVPQRARARSRCYPPSTIVAHPRRSS